MMHGSDHASQETSALHPYMYAEIHGNFTDVYRIVIACIEVEIIYYL